MQNGKMHTDKELPKDKTGLFQIATLKDLGIAVAQGAKAVHMYLKCNHHWVVDILDARDYLNNNNCPICLAKQVGTIKQATGFIPCNNCYRPDACAELGCGIKQGHRHDINPYSPIKKTA